MYTPNPGGDHDHGHSHDHTCNHDHDHDHGANGHSNSHSHDAPPPPPAPPPRHKPSHLRNSSRYAPTPPLSSQLPLTPNGFSFPSYRIQEEKHAPDHGNDHSHDHGHGHSHSHSHSYTSSSSSSASSSVSITPLLLATSLLLASLATAPLPVDADTDAHIDLLWNPNERQTVAPISAAHPPHLLPRVLASAGIAAAALATSALVGFVLLNFRSSSQNVASGGGGYVKRKNAAQVHLKDVAMLVTTTWAAYFAAAELGATRAVLVGVAAGGGFGVAGAGAVALAALWDCLQASSSVLGVVGAYAAAAAAVWYVRGKSVWPVDGAGREVWTVKAAALAGGVLACSVGAAWAFGCELVVESEWAFWAGAVGGVVMVVGSGMQGVVGGTLGIGTAVAGMWGLGMAGKMEVVTEVGLGALVLAATHFDARRRSGHNTPKIANSHSHSHSHSHSSHSHDHSHASRAPPSSASLRLLRLTENHPLLHSILLERDSRRISYFMMLNFAFMLVQTTYGFLTGSLGLISDSVHMFFDCLALGVGVCAAVMSKWPPSQRYPYGLSKMDTLAGFANGIFLMLISIEITWEAVERLQNPTPMARLGELLFVSTAGLAVNMVGIFAFDHAHHGHGHSHSHSHSDGEGGSDNMHGIFLHILADALGSVSVVISTLLIHYTGWPGFDPLASVLIAVLIFASSIPLVKSSASNLLLSTPPSVEYLLRETIAGIVTLPGVRAYRATRFWDTGDGGLRGVVHVTAEGEAGLVRRRVEEWIKDGVERGEKTRRTVDVTVVVERGGEGCWCH